MKKTVLLVEDNPVITGMYRNRLKAEGFEVKTALDGETGLAMLHKCKPDAVLLDLMLPKLSGIDFLKTLRSEDEFKDLPVVVFTNASGTDLMEKASSAGATEYLSKYNCPPKQVADALRAALAARQAGAAVTFTAAHPAILGGAASQAVALTPTRNAAAPSAPAKPTKTWEIPEMDIPVEPSILMLEDNDGMAELLRIFLEAQGFRVTRVTGGGEGLRQIMKRDFDAILCDMVMPNMPGDLFYLAVQRTKPHLCKRFIFMTGHHSDKKWDRFVEKVQCVMLWKPFQLAALLEAIKVVMAKAAAAMAPKTAQS